ncbi:MAG: type I methionyl aminopeptidase [Candidatus Omnitrophica bacterium]|nr:type I methionyl aminopeptidase [Candidatus Omnitrophota bacterium]
MGKSPDIRIKTPKEIQILREAGKILAGIFDDIKSLVKVGMTTGEIDMIAESLINNSYVVAAFKGYRGYPANACISVNEEVIHGIPGKRIIKDGDVVGIDIGIIYHNYYSDMAMTLGFGVLDTGRQKLLDVTRQSLMRGIAQAKPGNHLRDISHAVQSYVESKGFSVVRDFVGHGIGRSLHEDPEIPNYGSPGQGPLLKAGMVFAIEPMVNMGVSGTKVLSDGWTAVTADKKPSAHFEHTVAITESGPMILTVK